jgi:hypothetical protein
MGRIDPVFFELIHKIPAKFMANDRAHRATAFGRGQGGREMDVDFGSWLAFLREGGLNVDKGDFFEKKHHTVFEGNVFHGFDLWSLV